MANNFFTLKLCRARDNVEKCYGTGQATDENIIRRMRIACWVTKAANILSEYVTRIALPRPQREGVTVLFYTYAAYLVLYTIHRPTFLNNARVGTKLSLKCYGTRAETRFRLSAKRKSPFKSAGAYVQSTTGSRGVGISGSNVGYTMFRGSLKSTGYTLHSPVPLHFPSRASPCVITFQLASTIYREPTDMLSCTNARQHTATLHCLFRSNKPSRGMIIDEYVWACCALHVVLPKIS